MLLAILCFAPESGVNFTHTPLTIWHLLFLRFNEGTDSWHVQSISCFCFDRGDRGKHPFHIHICIRQAQCSTGSTLSWLSRSRSDYSSSSISLFISLIANPASLGPFHVMSTPPYGWVFLKGDSKSRFSGVNPVGILRSLRYFWGVKKKISNFWGVFCVCTLIFFS
jgi:hypothetical protein